MPVREDLVNDDYCYLTTTGRVTGRPHTVEIWFGISGSTIYMLAGGRDGSDWVRNMRKTQSVALRIRDREFDGHGRVVVDADEDAMARELLVSKYQPRFDG